MSKKVSQAQNKYYTIRRKIYNTKLVYSQIHVYTLRKHAQRHVIYRDYKSSKNSEFSSEKNDIEQSMARWF